MNDKCVGFESVTSFHALFESKVAKRVLKILMKNHEYPHVEFSQWEGKNGVGGKI